MMKDDDDDDLFSYSPGGARRTDPDTSRDAADSINVPDMELITLWAIGQRGVFGATWLEQEEIIERLRASCEIARLIIQRQSMSPRWTKLCGKGLLESRCDETGETIKRPGKTNRGQIVWFLTEAGAAILRLQAPRIDRLLKK